MTFDPFAMCRMLNEEGVEYVVLGGFAAILRGSPLPNQDIDSKRVANRPKDLMALPYLESLRDELRKRES